MQTKFADSRGRINLGRKFANKVFLVEEIGETEMKLHLARVVPESELWLSNNPETKEAILAALERLRAGRFSKNPPDLDVDEPWMKELED